MSKEPNYCQFIFKIADLGIRLRYEPLYINAMEILKLMPIDASVLRSLRNYCKQCLTPDEQRCSLTSLCLTESPTQFCYTLDAIYSLLLPAKNPLSDESLQFQFDFIVSGSGLKVLDLITKEDFLSEADDLSRV